MRTIFILAIGLVTILVVLLLVIVLIGIRQEPPSQELNEQALSPIAALVRRLLGVYVRKPHSSPNLDQVDVPVRATVAVRRIRPRGKAVLTPARVEEHPALKDR